MSKILHTHFNNADYVGNIKSYKVNKRVPQLVFWGRSNVGKSSLINAITGRKDLVRVSKTPGCTRMVNFFQVGSAFYLVDLPGYGYAKTSKKSVFEWFESVTEYFLNYRESIVRIFLLIDSEVGLKKADLEAIGFLDDNNLPYQFLLTKLDKIRKTSGLSAEEVAKCCVNSSACSFSEVIFTSVRNVKTISNLKNCMIALVQGSELR